MWLLNKFSKDELQIIEENEEFLSIQKDLQGELNRIEAKKAEFIDLQQLDDELESTIRKYEAYIHESIQRKLNAQVDYIAKDKSTAARRCKNDLIARIKEISGMPFKHGKSIL